ncbi:MAG TPA: ribonuclease P protein component [Methylocystis sp.]|nr:ribonuclease P protein component [Methylocystis sp.]
MATGAQDQDGCSKAAPKRLRRRAEFLRAASSGISRSLPAFKIQMARREDGAGEPRFGVTVTKKTAGAVGRNRIRRRLREAWRLGGALAGADGCDYVFVARRAALTAPFNELLTQMTEGLARIGRRGAAPSAPKRENGTPAP